ncbi:hypothetical protein [Paenibacillus alkalitolerans]|uniref:hypothetical protein n=1 Tax=Paenibacillus alkalitolerans TaxID=2799335 RepID=UPI0018F7340E|nr:hypothetical protein [Paenibacillus alkalitolerans]
MRRNIFAVLMLILIVGCTQTASNEYVTPSDYRHAQDMLDKITKQGIEIQEINNSNFMAIFQTKPNYAMFIKSDSGILELVRLEDGNGKEYAIETRESEVEGRFLYMITRNGEEEELMDSNAELYFHINDSYITITREKQLHQKLSKLFE